MNTKHNKPLSIFLTIIFGAIALQLGWQALAPYLPWVGATLAIAVCLLIGIGVFLLIRRLLTGGSDNPLIRGR